MSERGIEIHNGQVVFPEGMPQTLHMGTEASPLTQGEAGQILISAVINAVALGGNVRTGQFIIIASVNLTGNLVPLEAGITVNDGITVTGEVYGSLINTELLGAGIITERLDALRINMSSAAESEITGPVHGIFISNYNLGTLSADNYYFIRCQENGTAIVHYCLYFRGGSNGIDYFAQLHGSPDAWRAVGQPSGDNAGWIKVQLGSVDRWLRLYDAGPA